MALTNAEKVRAHRERKKVADDLGQKKSQAHLLRDIFKAPFFEFGQNALENESFDQYFDMIGLEAPDFVDDSGPQSRLGQLETSLDPDWRLWPEDARSLDRAEVMVGQLLDAASAMARVVNAFKIREIDARIAEIQPADLADPERKKAAIKKMVLLTKLRGQLEKDIRWPIKQWQVKAD